MLPIVFSVFLRISDSDDLFWYLQTLFKSVFIHIVSLYRRSHITWNHWKSLNLHYAFITLLNHSKYRIILLLLFILAKSSINPAHAKFGTLSGQTSYITGPLFVLTLNIIVRWCSVPYAIAFPLLVLRMTL